MNLPPADENDDPWMPHSIGMQTQYCDFQLQMKTIVGLAPLDAQIGVFPKKTVPEALYQVLFDQPEPTESEIEAAGGDISSLQSAQTYAILDAAKIANLPELLAQSGLNHRCLFKGDALQTLKDVAPWIVRLEDDNRFTRNLFTRSPAPWHLWDAEPGIYVCTRGSLDEMWRHFRKFTRVQAEAGKWYYLRFWEPRWAQQLLRDPYMIGGGRFLAGIRRLIALDADGRAEVALL